MGLLVAGAVVAAGTVPARAQDDLEVACESAASRCPIAAAAVRLIHPRVGKALWGGNPVPGTASTLGMRIGAYPRISLSARLNLVPVELPPLLDADDTDGDGALLTGLAAQGTIGILNGFSPLPTVGGVLSLDGIARVSWAPLSRGRGFEGGAWAGSVGLRVGALRESFTLPGVSLTGTWGRSTDVTFGDPEGGTDGWVEGAISNLAATVALTKRIARVGITAGAAWDRYASDVGLAWATTAGGITTRLDAEAVTTRRSWFVNASLTSLVFHGSAELGWQEAPVPGDLPPSITLDPPHLWVGLAFRLSI